MSDELPESLMPPAASPRLLAAERGLARYADGVPCPHGHVGQRYTRNAYCCECQRLATLADRQRIRGLMDGRGKA